MRYYQSQWHIQAVIPVFNKIMAIINPLKRTLKQTLQIFAARFGPHTRHGKAPRLLVLMYHRILPQDDERAMLEEPGMQVTPTTFQQNLETISHYFEFVKLSDWLENRQKGIALPAKACAITFDDGWSDNYEYAFPILHKLEVPATIFLVSDMIGTQAKFWPERLARQLYQIATRDPDLWSSPALRWLRDIQAVFPFAHRPVSKEQLSQLIQRVKRFSDEEIHQRLDKMEAELGLEVNQQASLLNWKQIEEMTASGLIEVGSHTRRHIRLCADTSTQTLRQEIVSSKHTIESHTGQPVKTFCFPNGDYTDAALQLVRQHYAGAVTTEHGWNSHTADSHLLHRIGIHNDIAADRTALLARLSGWL